MIPFSHPSTLLLPSSSSFDPAVHLHSEGPTPTANAPIEEKEGQLPAASDSFSDDLEALEHTHLEQERNKVVIKHRAWDLSDVFRSGDEDIRPS